ncbi:response regulator transcription factor [Escherichia coli]|uniref:response regulator transcription factor n=1 Tax=Escherichia coli TaxID=562 RepID=UPI001863EE9F|nr:LuxR C-terminal-related transcriptional regulator [Escherichia coli]
MNTGRENICIYSDNIFFISGVRTLVSEVFNKRKYVIRFCSEKEILNMMSINDVPDGVFVFSDTKNALFLSYLRLFFRNDIISGDRSIEDVRNHLLSEKRCYPGAHLQMELSPREIEIVACMKLRMTDNEIASRFKLSRKTVSAHRRNILLKLGIKNRNELYKYLFGLRRPKNEIDRRCFPV